MHGHSAIDIHAHYYPDAFLILLRKQEGRLKQASIGAIPRAYL